MPLTFANRVTQASGEDSDSEALSSAASLPSTVLLDTDIQPGTGVSRATRMRDSHPTAEVNKARISDSHDTRDDFYRGIPADVVHRTKTDSLR